MGKILITRSVATMGKHARECPLNEGKQSVAFTRRGAPQVTHAWLIMSQC